MKGRNLLSGFLAAIITVLLVVSPADGGEPNGDDKPDLEFYPKNGAEVTEKELKENGIKFWSSEPIAKFEIKDVLAGGYHLKGWKVEMSDDGTAGRIWPGETSHHTRCDMKWSDDSGNSQSVDFEVSWETRILLELSFGDSFGPLDENALRSSYMENTEDLDMYATKVQFFNEQKRQIRAYIQEIRDYRLDFERFIASCTATLTDLATGESDPGCLDVEILDADIVRLTTSKLQPNTKFLLELYLTDQDGNHGYCALFITNPDDKEDEK